MNIKNTILIFTFVLIGLSSASFAKAISCPTDNGAGVVCSGGTPYYCGASCRSTTTMAGFCPTNAFTASAPCTALDACGACSTCATNYLLCTGPAYPTRSCTYNDPNNHCATLTGGNCNAGVCATCVGGYGLCNADSTCRVANCQPYETWNTTSCSCVGSVPTLKLGYDSVISSTAGTAVKQSALSVLSVFYGGNVSINNATSTSALSVSGGNIFINDSVITSGTPNAAITKSYLDSSLLAYSSANSMWQLSGNNLFASSTAWNVGIGTTTPLAKLHISDGQFKDVYIGSAVNTGAPDLATLGAGITFTRTNMQQPDSGIAAYTSTIGANNLLIKARSDVVFVSGNSNDERMRIKELGNVGIGTTTPSAALDIFGKAKITSAGTIYNTDSTRYLDMTGILTDSLKVSGDFYSTAGELKTDGTGINYMLGSLSVGTNNPLARLDVYNSAGGFVRGLKLSNNASAAEDGVYMQFNTATTPGANDNYGPYIGSRRVTGGAGHLVFGTATAAAPTTILERMRINSDGLVGIGTTNPISELQINASDNHSILLNPGTSNQSISFIHNDNGNVNANYASITAYLNNGALGYNAGHLLFNTAPNTLGNPAPIERMRIDYNGNVGIATTSPDAKLQVNGSFHVSGSLNSVVFDKLTGTGGRIVMADATGSLYATSSSVATGLPVGTAGQTLRSDGTNWLANSVIYNNGTNVGIGTTSPSYKLDVSGNARLYNPGAPTVQFITGERLGDNNGTFPGIIALGYHNSSAPVSNGYYGKLGRVTFGGNHTDTSMGNILYAAAIEGAAEGVFSSSTTMPTALTFYTGSTGSAANVLNANIGIERMRITSSGSVGIGTTTPSAALDVFGKAKITSAGTIYNTDSTRYLDMTGVLTDSLKISGNIYTTAGLFKSDSTGNNYMLGNLGIGTATPTGARLDVNGLIKMRVTSGFISSDEDVINKGYLDSAIQAATSSISGTGKFVGMTFFKYDGNNTQEGGANAGMGYAVANTLCDMNAQGSHVCSSAEMLNSIASGVTMPVENAWIFNGPPGFTTSANDCDARTLNTTSVSFPNFGTYWEGTDLGYSSGRGLLRTCDKYMKYACCK